MDSIISRISSLPNMDLKPAAKDNDIDTFEQVNSVILPRAYREWLLVSDGGDIFIPSIQLYGVNAIPKIEIGDGNDVPASYFIIGHTSFGDAICFKSGSDMIVQWSHEENEEYLSWDNFYDFLKDSEEDYGDSK